MEAARATSPTAFVKLRQGPAGIPAFERRLEDLAARAPVPAGSEEFSPYVLEVPSLQRPGIALTARVLVIGLLLFGGIAGLSALLVAALTLRRQLQIAPADELHALTAIGVTDRQVAGAHWLAALPFMLTGTVTAVALALAGGTIGPIGSIESLEPAPGFRVNGALLAAGIVVALVSLAIAAALAAAPSSTSPPARTTRASRTVRAAHRARRAASRGARHGTRARSRRGTRPGADAAGTRVDRVRDRRPRRRRRLRLQPRPPHRGARRDGDGTPTSSSTTPTTTSSNGSRATSGSPHWRPSPTSRCGWTAGGSRPAPTRARVGSGGLRPRAGCPAPPVR